VVRVGPVRSEIQHELYKAKTTASEGNHTSIQIFDAVVSIFILLAGQPALSVAETPGQVRQIGPLVPPNGYQCSTTYSLQPESFFTLRPGIAAHFHVLPSTPYNRLATLEMNITQQLPGRGHQYHRPHFIIKYLTFLFSPSLAKSIQSFRTLFYLPLLTISFRNTYTFVMAQLARNKIGVIIGTGGMGLATAHRLGPSRQIFVANYAKSNVEAAVKPLHDEGFVVDGQQLDIADYSSAEKLASIAAKAGEIDAIVYSAGLEPLKQTRNVS
jgi:hypothetical protein